MGEFLAVYVENWVDWQPQILKAVWVTVQLTVCAFALAVVDAQHPEHLVAVAAVRRVQNTAAPEERIIGQSQVLTKPDQG